MKTLKGVGANRGKVTGKAHIVSDPGKVAKAEKGAILVTPFTTPMMVLAIKDAIAIVTEFGGLTSHAAIVAREFGKPCIVNVKEATKILKEGETITVDGEKGIVEYE